MNSVGDRRYQFQGYLDRDLKAHPMLAKDLHDRVVNSVHCLGTQRPAFLANQREKPVDSERGYVCVQSTLN